MELKELGEFGLIDRLAAQAARSLRPGTIGIGDDCAVFRASPQHDLLLTTDMLVENIHFIRALTTPWDLGRKSIAVNLSDIAACGGTPRHAVVSVALPPNLDVEFALGLFQGICDCAREHNVDIVGGDTTSSPRDLVINVALTGEVEPGRAVLRSGAKPGDLIFLTGPAGDAAAGLDLLLHHRQLVGEYPALAAAYHNPTPHVAEGRIIGQSGYATAMIDVSDGVAADLTHLCRASGVGARIFADKLPKSTMFRDYAMRVGLNIHEFAVSGGEDYILLMTVDPAHASALANLLAVECRRPLHHIGVMTADTGLEYVLPDGSAQPLIRRGWDHFRQSET